MAPPYRVMLHNDNYNKREYVVQVLMKVIPGMTVDNAVNIMQEAHYNGLAVVIICAQVDAEEHCMQLRGNGLLSSIEPASGGCWVLTSIIIRKIYFLGNGVQSMSSTTISAHMYINWEGPILREKPLLLCSPKLSHDSN